jgi:lipoprotein-releasing system permease protein
MNLDRLLYPEKSDEVVLHAAVLEYGILGVQLAVQLGLRADFDTPLRVFAPKRGERVNMANPMSSFNSDELISPGYVFQVKQSKYDANYIIASLGFAQRLFDQRGRISQVELKLKPGTNVARAKRDIRRQLGERFVVRDRYEQQSDVFRIMKIEKLISYLFLTFILLVASFNIIGSLTMLMIDKQRDIQTLHNLGATQSAVQRIFVLEGNLISLSGALFGLVVGVLLCWIQQRYGVISMGRSEGSFIVEAYPVVVRGWDLVVIFLTVLATSALVVWYPVRRQINKL